MADLTYDFGTIHRTRGAAQTITSSCGGNMGTVKAALLGPFEIVVAEKPLPIRAQKQRILLATLLQEHPRPVPMERLIHHLWGEKSPQNKRAAFHIHLTRLRQSLTHEHIGLENAIVSTPGGYALRIPDLDIDLLRYEKLIARAQEARARGDDGAEYRFLKEALALVRGELLEDVPTQHSYAEERASVMESYVSAAEQFYALQIDGGHHSHAVAGLRTLVAAHPLRESTWHLLMRALITAGRNAEAVEAFGKVRKVLAEELGVEPGAQLRDLFHDLLAA